MKKVVMIIGFLVAVSAVQGQSSLSFYAEAGIGISRLYGGYSGSDTQTAYKAGVGVEHTLNRTQALQSVLEFISIGGKDGTQYMEHARMHELYLQIPVVVAARLPLGENYRASLDLGPYTACGVGGKTFGSIKQDYAHSSHDGCYRFRISTSGSVLENKAGNRRLGGGAIIEIAFRYRRFIISVEAQIGLMKANQQLRQAVEIEEFQGYLPKNFASFFTMGYKLRQEFC